MLAAIRGKTSQIWTPATLVAIGLNSPRISEGASVLMSHMSWCGGPPPRKMLMTALWLVWPGRDPARGMSASDKEAGPQGEGPLFRKPRRGEPGHSRFSAPQTGGRRHGP